MRSENISEAMEEVLRWRPWPGPDPALRLLLQEVDQSVRQQILAGYIEQQKAILQAQMAFHDTLLQAMSGAGRGAKRGG